MLTVVLGESQTYPPSPLLLVLTTDGLIIPYHMIYTHKDTPIITAPKEQISASGLRKQAGKTIVALNKIFFPGKNIIALGEAGIFTAKMKN